MEPGERRFAWLWGADRIAAAKCCNGAGVAEGQASRWRFENQCPKIQCNEPRRQASRRGHGLWRRGTREGQLLDRLGSERRLGGFVGGGRLAGLNGVKVAPSFLILDARCGLLVHESTGQPLVQLQPSVENGPEL